MNGLTTTNGKHEYASDRDELVALIETSTGRRPDLKLMRSIAETLELRGATVRAFIDDTTPRLSRLSNQAGEGFFLNQAKKWGSESATPADEPQLKSTSVTTNGRCAKCGGVGKSGDSYCDCPMGKDLKKIELRPMPVARGGDAAKPKARAR